MNDAKISTMDERTLLAEIGEALYGRGWKPEMAAALGVDDRSLRRWIQTNTVPLGVWRDLQDILVARCAVITALHGKVNGRL